MGREMEAADSRETLRPCAELVLAALMEVCLAACLPGLRGVSPRCTHAPGDSMSGSALCSSASNYSPERTAAACCLRMEPLQRVAVTSACPGWRGLRSAQAASLPPAAAFHELLHAFMAFMAPAAPCFQNTPSFICS